MDPNPPIRRLALSTSASAIALAALTWSNVALCGEVHDAAKAGDLAKVKELLASGVDVNAKDLVDRTPLHCAATENRKEMAEFLLAVKADINAKDKNGLTPLHAAARFAGKELLELLLANGANVGAKDN